MTFTDDQMLMVRQMIANASESLIAAGTMVTRDAGNDGTCRIQPGTQAQSVKVSSTVDARPGDRVTLIRTGPTEWTVVARFGQHAPDQQIFDATATWTKPAGAQWLRVRVQAPGGGGGGPVVTGSNTSAGAGAQAGAYAESWILADNVTATVAVTIGAAGTSAAGGIGTDAGSASFGAYVTATGGQGASRTGAGTTPIVVIGGNATPTMVGQIQIPGAAGGPGMRLDANAAVSGAGGNSVWGAGGIAVPNGNDGWPGRGYGAGGGGGANGPSQSARPGGAGAPGRIIVGTFF